MSDFKDRVTEFEHYLQQNLADIYCPIHLCLGAEQVPEALHDCLKPDDWLFAYHRSHGHALAKGVTEQELLDEILGLETAKNKGFSGSQSYIDPALNFHCSAIVGGLIGVATGTALALKLNKSKAIVVCVFGDAGVEQGVFWESLNFAALNELPIAYICENNGMSVDAPYYQRQATPIRQRVKAFGVEVRGTVERVLAIARTGKPAFYEALVERKCAHLNMRGMTEM